MEPEAVYIKKSPGTIIGTIIFSILVTIIFPVIVFHTIKPESTSAIFLMVMCGGLLVFINFRCWSWVVDTKAAIIINREGIIYRKKMLFWENIKSYQTIFIKPFSSDDSSQEEVSVTFKNDTRLLIKLMGLNTNLSEMRTYITRYAGDHKVIDEGHVEK